jgi:hypothetical protein
MEEAGNNIVRQSFKLKDAFEKHRTRPATSYRTRPYPLPRLPSTLVAVILVVVAGAFGRSEITAITFDAAAVNALAARDKNVRRWPGLNAL